MTNNEQEKPTPAPQGTRSGLIVAALFLVAACAVVLYGIRAHGGKEASNQCVDARPVAARVAPLARGQVAAMSVPATPRPAIDVSFNDPAGKKTDLSAFRGKTILLNLWATWCIPCREEMPALDRLQARLGGPNFEVVAVNIDTVRLDKRKAFLQEAGVTHLNFYADSSADIFQALKKAGKVVGLPTTMLIGPGGCEIGLMPGPADWSSEDAAKLVSAALPG